MEMLGLALAIPAVLIANVGYGVLAKFVLSRLAGFRRWLVWPSYLVLVLTLIDITLVATIGAVEARTRIGPTFWFLHLLVIFLGASTASKGPSRPDVKPYKRLQPTAALGAIMTRRG
jgi:hypothetical protein